MLAVEIQGGSSFALTGDMPGWSEVSRNLPAHLTGALPYEAWVINAAFDNERNEPVWVYQRPETA
jgi:hypothetical protein